MGKRNDTHVVFHFVHVFKAQRQPHLKRRELTAAEVQYGVRSTTLRNGLLTLRYS